MATPFSLLLTLESCGKCSILRHHPRLTFKEEQTTLILQWVHQGTIKAPYSQLYKSILSREIFKVVFYSCITGLKLVLQVLKLEWKAVIKILEEIQFEEPQAWNHLSSAVTAIKLHRYSSMKTFFLKSTSRNNFNC